MSREPRGGKSQRIPPMPQEENPISQETTPPTSNRRNGHVEGINRQTGERTLVGTYLPIMVAGKFTCADPKCQTRKLSWTTKNGYKYHLTWTCPQTKEERDLLKAAAGLPIKEDKEKPEFECECECGRRFRSKNGYLGHRNTNDSTRDGRCLIRAQRRLAAQQRQAREEVNETRGPGNMD